MQPLEIIIGGLFVIAAVILVVIAFTEETVIAIGAAIIVGVIGGYGIYHGAHGEHAKFASKHASILRDLRNQGFTVQSNHVFAVGGNYLQGTEVDLTRGYCQWEFEATKVAGTWRITLPAANGNGVRVLTPGEASKLLAVCP